MYKLQAPFADLDRDRLTGLPGSELVRERLRQWGLAGPQSGHGDPAAVIHGLMLGICQFAMINLAFGGAGGDKALRAIASRLTRFADEALGDDAGTGDGLVEAQRGQWLVARCDGAKFVVVTNQPCSAEHWQLFAERLADLIAEPIAYGQETLRLSPRLVLVHALPQESADAMRDRMRRSLTAAKRDVGLRVVWADSDTIGRSAAQLDIDLLKAIDRNEIEMLYQPQYALFECANDSPCSGRRLSGAEALARWNHPVLGRIGATELFAIAERTDHVLPLSRHIAEIALAAARHWPADLRLSINITPAELALPHFAADLSKAVRHSGFSPQLLTLEITEQAAITDIERAADSLADLVRQGVRIALDDFGAGFCNFQYLKTLPLNYIKLDRSMLSNIVEDPRDLAVLRAIVAMARALGLEVIAEGIESEAQADIAAREGCAYFQGYFCAHPVAADEFLTLAREAAEA